MKKSRAAAQLLPLSVILPFLLFLITGSISVIAETSEADARAAATESDTETQGILPLFRNYMTENRSGNGIYLSAVPLSRRALLPGIRCRKSDSAVNAYARFRTSLRR